MKKYSKLLTLFLTLTVLLVSSGCNTHETESHKESGTDKRVLSAIKVLEKHWNKNYEENEIEDKYLEIINTRIININDNIDSEEIYGKDDWFKDIDYIVEFELLSNYYDSAPCYFNVLADNCVIVYKDRTKEVSRNLLNVYRTTTYSNDFSPIVESIEEFHDEYDQTLELE